VERNIGYVKVLYVFLGVLWTEILVTKRYYVSCEGFVDRNICDVKMLCEFYVHGCVHRLSVCLLLTNSMSLYLFLYLISTVFGPS
jgi:Ni,Fe-hydrogenase I cytochrome b subunit